MSTRDTLNFRLTKEVREALRQVAEREQRSMAWMVELAVKELIERRKARDEAATSTAGDT